MVVVGRVGGRVCDSVLVRGGWVMVCLEGGRMAGVLWEL